MDTDQLTEILFKDYMGTAKALKGKQFYEETEPYNKSIIGSYVWTQDVKSNPSLHDWPDNYKDIDNNTVIDSSDGILQYCKNIILTPINGGDGGTSFRAKDSNDNNLINIIPHNYGGELSNPYVYSLKKENGEQIFFGPPEDWLLDTGTGILTFYGTPPTDMETPTLSFYRYIGKKGFSDLATSGDVTGNVVGDVCGNVIGHLTGDVSANYIDVSENIVVGGTIIGDISANTIHVGDITITGDISGNLEVLRGPSGEIGPEGPQGISGEGITDISAVIVGNSTIVTITRETNKNGGITDISFTIPHGVDGNDGTDGSNGDIGPQGISGEGITDISAVIVGNSTIVTITRETNKNGGITDISFTIPHGIQGPQGPSGESIVDISQNGNIITFHSAKPVSSDNQVGPEITLPIGDTLSGNVTLDDITAKNINISDGTFTITNNDNYTKIDASNAFISYNRNGLYGGSKYIKVHKNLSDNNNEIIDGLEPAMWNKLYIKLDDPTQFDNTDNQTGMINLKVELYGTDDGICIIYIRKYTYNDYESNYSWFSNTEKFDVSNVTIYDKTNNNKKTYISIELKQESRYYTQVSVELYGSEDELQRWDIDGLEVLGTNTSYTAFDDDINGTNVVLVTYKPFRHKELVTGGIVINGNIRGIHFESGGTVMWHHLCDIKASGPGNFEIKIIGNNNFAESVDDSAGGVSYIYGSIKNNKADTDGGQGNIDGAYININTKKLINEVKFVDLSRNSLEFPIDLNYEVWVNFNTWSNSVIYYSCGDNLTMTHKNGIKNVNGPTDSSYNVVEDGVMLASFENGNLYMTGNIITTGDISGNFVGNTTTDTVVSNIVGDICGNLVGNVLAQDGSTIVLENGTDGTDAVFTGSVVGDVSGNVTGHLTGDVSANNIDVNGNLEVHGEVRIFSEYNPTTGYQNESYNDDQTGIFLIPTKPNSAGNDASNRILFNEDSEHRKFGFSLFQNGSGNETSGVGINAFGILYHQNDENGNAALTIDRTNGNVGIGVPIADSGNQLEVSGHTMTDSLTVNNDISVNGDLTIDPTGSITMKGNIRGYEYSVGNRSDRWYKLCTIVATDSGHFEIKIVGNTKIGEHFDNVAGGASYIYGNVKNNIEANETGKGNIDGAYINFNTKQLVKGVVFVDLSGNSSGFTPERNYEIWVKLSNYSKGSIFYSCANTLTMTHIPVIQYINNDTDGNNPDISLNEPESTLDGSIVVKKGVMLATFEDGNLTIDKVLDVSGGIIGNLTGDVTGNLSGNIVKDGTTIFNTETSTITGDVILNGDLDVSGNVVIDGEYIYLNASNDTDQEISTGGIILRKHSTDINGYKYNCSILAHNHGPTNSTHSDGLRLFGWDGISFCTDSNSNNIKEKMRINYHGNVGIGTSKPSSKLEVVGDISASSIYVGDVTATNIDVNDITAPNIDVKDINITGSLTGVDDNILLPKWNSWYQLGGDIDGEVESYTAGYSVSLSADGKIVAIGSPRAFGGNYITNVRIYQYNVNNASWNQLGTDISGEAVGDKSGWSVSLSADGKIVAIGAPNNDGYTGTVRIYQYNENDVSWNKLGDDINGEASNDQSGYSVSLSADGKIVAIGTPYNDGTTGDFSGHVRVYQYNDVSWNKLGGDIDAEAASDFSGVSVSLSADGSIVAIGAPGHDGTTDSDIGHVRVYKYDASKTTAETDPNSDNFGPEGWSRLGSDIDGEAAGDFSGWSVSLSANGKIVAIGAPKHGGGKGVVCVYQYNGSTWNKLGDPIDGVLTNIKYGSTYHLSVSLSADGSILAVGAPYIDDNGDDRGHVRVYQYDDNDISWNLIQEFVGEAAGDEFGYSVSLSAFGNTVAIGAPYNDVNTGDNTNNSGHVRVFKTRYYPSNELIVPKLIGDVSASSIYVGDITITGDISGNLEVLRGPSGETGPDGPQGISGEGITDISVNRIDDEGKTIITITRETDKDGGFTNVSFTILDGIQGPQGPSGESISHITQDEDKITFFNTSNEQVGSQITLPVIDTITGDVTVDSITADNITANAGGSITMKGNIRGFQYNTEGHPDNNPQDSSFNKWVKLCDIEASNNGNFEIKIIGNTGYAENLFNESGGVSYIYGAVKNNSKGDDTGKGNIDGAYINFNTQKLIRGVKFVDLSGNSQSFSDGILNYQVWVQFGRYSSSVIYYSCGDNLTMTHIPITNGSVQFRIDPPIDNEDQVVKDGVMLASFENGSLDVEGEIRAFVRDPSYSFYDDPPNDETGIFLIPGKPNASGNHASNRIFFSEDSENRNWGFSLLQNGHTETSGVGTNAFGILYHQNDVSGNAALTIDRTNGNVGIGVSKAASGNQLEVSGNTVTDSLTVNNNITVTGTMIGDVSGNVTGHLEGDVSANNIDVTGNITGNLIGDVSGNVTGHLEGDVSANNIDVTCNITGNLIGDVSGNVTGHLEGDVSANNIDVTGNITGNLIGDVTGDVTGNVTASEITVSDKIVMKGNIQGHSIVTTNTGGGHQAWYKLCDIDATGLGNFEIKIVGNQGMSEEGEKHAGGVSYIYGAVKKNNIGVEDGSGNIDGAYLNINTMKLIDGVRFLDLSGNTQFFSNGIIYNYEVWVHFTNYCRNVVYYSCDEKLTIAHNTSFGDNDVDNKLTGESEPISAGETIMKEGVMLASFENGNLYITDDGNNAKFIYGNVVGNLSGNVTGHLEGDVSANQIEVNDINITGSLTGVDDNILLPKWDSWYQLGGDIDRESNGDNSGWSVSLSADGKILAIGVPGTSDYDSNRGHIRVYQYNENDASWNQLGSDIDGEAITNKSGYSVSLSADGTIVAIGAPYNNGNDTYSGHVRVYQYNETDLSWNQLGSDIDGEAAGDYSGWSVSLSAGGTIVAIGAPYNNGNDTDSGHVRVYQYNETDASWNQLGSDIDGEAADDQSGYSVSLSADGTIVAIGAPKNYGTTGDFSGHVRVYQYNENDVSWNQLGGDIDAEAESDNCGCSVSLSADGKIVAIGALGNDGTVGNNNGHVRVYQYNDVSWNQLGDDIDGEASGDQSGYSVSLSADGTIVAIGAKSAKDENDITTGHVRVYQYDGSSWNLIQEFDGEAAGDQYGYSVSLSSHGNTVAIGAIQNVYNNSTSGYVRVFKTQYYSSNEIIARKFIGNLIGDVSGNVTGHLEGDVSANQIDVTGDLTVDGTMIGNLSGNVTGHLEGDVSANQIDVTGDVNVAGIMIGDVKGKNTGFTVSRSSTANSNRYWYNICKITSTGPGDFEIKIMANDASNNIGGGATYIYGTVEKAINQSIEWSRKKDDGITNKTNEDCVINGSYQTFNTHTPIVNDVILSEFYISHATLCEVWVKIEQFEDFESLTCFSSASDSITIEFNDNLGNTNDVVYRNNSIYDTGMRLISNAVHLGSFVNGDVTVDGKVIGDVIANQIDVTGDVTVDGTMIGDVKGKHIGVTISRGLGTQAGDWYKICSLQSTAPGNFEIKIMANDATTDNNGGASYIYGTIKEADISLNGDPLPWSITHGIKLKDNAFCIINGSYINYNTHSELIGDVRFVEHNGFTWSSHLTTRECQVWVYLKDFTNASVFYSISDTLIGLPEIGDLSSNTPPVYITPTTYQSNYLTYDAVHLGSFVNGNVTANNIDITGSLTGVDNNILLPKWDSWYQLGGDIDGEAADDDSGWSVSLSADGKIVAIGAPYNDGNGGSSGHVRVYQYNGTQWGPLGDPIIGEAAGDNSGFSVSLSADGKIVAIGAPNNDGNDSSSGHVRVYQYNENDASWNQLGTDIDGESVGNSSGYSVSLSADGSIVAIGAPYNGYGGDGHVRVYQYNETDASWNQLGSDIDGQAIYNYNYSGWSVSLSADGKIVAIGATGNVGTTGEFSGHVRVYKYDQNKTEAEPDESSVCFGPAHWTRLGSDIDGEAAGDYFGYSVSLSADGTILAIGARHNDGPEVNDEDNRGHVRVYQYNETDASWNQLGSDIDGEAAGDNSGFSVSLSADGKIVAIGSRYNNGNTGHVRVYQYDGSSWNLIQEFDGEAAGDNSGHSVSLSADGTILAIGATNAKDENGVESGHVRVFHTLYSNNNNGIIAPIVFGNVTGNVTGHLTGDVTGNVTGNVTVTDEIVIKGNMRGFQYNTGGYPTNNPQDSSFNKWVKLCDIEATNHGNFEIKIIGNHGYSENDDKGGGGVSYIYGSVKNNLSGEDVTNKGNIDGAYINFNTQKLIRGVKFVDLSGNSGDSYGITSFNVDRNYEVWVQFSHYSDSVIYYSCADSLTMTHIPITNSSTQFEVGPPTNSGDVVVKDGVMLASFENGSLDVEGEIRAFKRDPSYNSYDNAPTDETGIFLIPGDPDYKGDHSSNRIFFSEDSENRKWGFSLFQNGSNSETRGVPSNTFGILYHKFDETGKPALTIDRDTGDVTIPSTSNFMVDSNYIYLNSSLNKISNDNSDSGGIILRKTNDSDINKYKYNCSILAHNHQGVWADGLRLYGWDGISFVTGDPQDDNDTTTKERMRIAQNGNVSIPGNFGVGAAFYLGSPDYPLSGPWAEDIINPTGQGYNLQTTFTGQHSNYGINETINNVGFIVRSTGNYRNQMKQCDECNKHKITINESLPIVEYPSKANDKAVWGVISNKEDNSDKHYKVDGRIIQSFDVAHEDRPLRINSLGEGAMWVTNINGPLENGDYMTSSLIPGLGMKQNDDLLHNYTVAKITMDCNFDDEQRPAKQLRYETVQYTDASGVTTDISQAVIDPVTQQFVYDLVFDDSGNQVFVDKYDEKWIRIFADKYVIYNDKEETDEYFTYEFDFANASTDHVDIIGNQYQMAFVGCTYHCG